ncbi:MAG TPA: hypothetical protein VEG66_02220 [Thermoplasmata archaeon]|jgi:hypothetical protein|nr:hypothetical protein [Thermoplasmata archaeon]
MQLISVERWTFWAGLATAFLAPILTALLPSYVSNGTTVTISWVSLVFILLLVSVALGGSRDPSVRQVPARPDA